MTDPQTDGCLAIVLAMIVTVSTAILLIAQRAEISDLRAQAIENGYAEWVVDEKTGTTTWRWKQQSPIWTNQ